MLWVASISVSPYSAVIFWYSSRIRPWNNRKLLTRSAARPKSIPASYSLSFARPDSSRETLTSIGTLK